VDLHSARTYCVVGWMVPKMDMVLVARRNIGPLPEIVLKSRTANGVTLLPEAGTEPE